MKETFVAKFKGRRKGTRAGKAHPIESQRVEVTCDSSYMVHAHLLRAYEKMTDVEVTPLVS